MYLFRINKKVVLRVCGKKKSTKKKKKPTRLRHVLFYDLILYFFIFLMMYVCIWLSMSAYVCV